MGWLTDDGRHEGYLVAVVEKDGLWRELGYKLPWNPELDAVTWYPVETVQVGCDCGWRSPRFLAAAGTRWAPNTVDSPEHFEDECRALWLAHIESDQRPSLQPASSHTTPSDPSRSTPPQAAAAEAPKRITNVTPLRVSRFRALVLSFRRWRTHRSAATSARPWTMRRSPASWLPS